MAALEVEGSNYFSAMKALRSDDATIRRQAIDILLGLAGHATEPVRSRARRALQQEFGPYAVTDGLAGCAAPIQEVQVCDADGRDCRTCKWVWLEPFAAAFPNTTKRREPWSAGET